jgi:signal transduction histidine kinase
VLSWVQENSIGIGLSIAKGLIEAHQGQIWAESLGPGKGATFKVLLPFISTTLLESIKR